MAKRRFTLSLNEDIFSLVDALCEKETRALSEQVEHMLKQQLKAQGLYKEKVINPISYYQASTQPNVWNDFDDPPLPE